MLNKNENSTVPVLDARGFALFLLPRGNWIRPPGHKIVLRGHDSLLKLLAFTEFYWSLNKYHFNHNSNKFCPFHEKEKSRFHLLLILCENALTHAFNCV